jgi:SAM-dependent methyltransferase
LAGELPHCKLCELEDFSDPELSELVREIFTPDLERFGDDFPAGREYRKYWEIAMTARALRDGGALRRDAEVLGVGAGHEATVFWLTTQVGRVVATDLYETEDRWSDTDANPTMLTDPGRYWAGEWEPDRLEAEHMDARELRFPDESFDAIFSSSSIEHFGDPADVRRSAEQMCRVLRPGGILALATEYRLEGPPPGFEGVLLFDRSELTRLLLDGMDLELLSPLDDAISELTLATEQDLGSAVGELQEHARTADPTAPIEWANYPHIVLRAGGHLFTSVHLAMRRQPAAPR